MNSPPRTQSLASCYENAITIILRLSSQQQAVQNSQLFRTNIRAALKAAMEQAKALGYSNEMIQLSFSAVVGFLDESVLMLQSPIFADWPQRPLQEELFGHHRMGEVFFENLRSLLGRPDTQETADCLEVYCLCLLLGYRGRYALGGGGEIETFVRPDTGERSDVVAVKCSFFAAGTSPPEIKRTAVRSTAGAGPWALPHFACCWPCCLAFGGFWFSLSSGLSQLGLTRTAPGGFLLIYLLALAVVLVAVLVAYGAEALLHLHGTPLILLASLVVLAGIAAAVAILVIHFRARKRKAREKKQPGR